ncbi:MAG: polysaccharide pyruvyl transferase family protein [Oceanihabitans sp.]
MNTTQKNIVIINSVPINGGDEALLKATISILQNNFENPNISILCNNPVLYKKYFPTLDLHWDWEYSFFCPDTQKPSLVFKIKRKIRFYLNQYLKLSYAHFFSKMLASKREQSVLEILKNSDFVIASAGGYIHDFYGFNKRLNTIEFIHKVLRKPYYIFYQSVGPFWKPENYQRLNQVFKNAKKVIVREHYSVAHLKNIGYTASNIVLSNDIAFYLNKEYSKPVNVDRKLKRIAINFRAWRYETESEQTLEKAVKLCNKLVLAGYQLSFISTCQGVPGYTNDTIYFKEIMAKLAPKIQAQIHINTAKMSLENFLQEVATCDAYIGMRLHGAILSLMAGIPVLNIAYEDKSLGIFKALNLEDCSFSFKENMDTWFTKTDAFIENYKTYLNSIETKRKEAETVVANHFKEHIVNA